MRTHEGTKEKIGYLLARICHSHRNKVNEELSKIDLHVGQEMFLLRLWESDGIAQSELADCFCVQQATVTRMLERMEKAGLIKRSRDPEDQRVSRVYLTDLGRSLEQPVVKIWEELESSMLASFTLEEKLLLRRLLLQLYENLTD